MEYSEQKSTVALGGWRERLKRLSVRREGLADNDLAARTLEGDLRSYEELVRRYERLVGHVLYTYAGREAAVDDLVQETFLKAYDKLESFNPEYKFKTWLLAIANNLGVDTVRRRREQVEFNPEIHARIAVGPEAAAVEADRSRTLQEAMSSLPETYGVPMILRYNEEMSYAEISEVLQLSIPAVKSRLFRARQMLARAVGDSLDDERLSGAPAPEAGA
jgi:RNA polymerase sigma-70 factor (ECF subfamily)